MSIHIQIDDTSYYINVYNNEIFIRRVFYSMSGQLYYLDYNFKKYKKINEYLIYPLLNRRREFILNDINNLITHNIITEFLYHNKIRQKLTKAVLLQLL